MREESKRPEVTVVGSFMMDLVVRAARRPEVGETLVGDTFEMFLGGKGFNQAIAAARAGARTAMIGRVGADDFGKCFLDALQRDRIDAEFVTRDEELGTGVGLPLVERTGANSIVVVPRANHRQDAGSARAAKPAIESARVVLLQLELPVEVALETARIARAAGRTVVLNPAPAGDAGLGAFEGLVDYVVPNESEAERLTGIRAEGAGLRNAAQALVGQTGARGVVLTLGARGVALYDGGGIELLAPHAVECIDSVGAGDAFCGAFAAKLARGATLAEAARYGNAAGALACTRAGAEPSMPTAAEVEGLLR
jgi:ribokinase